MSFARVLEILVSLGFSRAEGRVYLYLSKRGPQTSNYLTTGLQMSKQRLYPILRRLEEKEAVTRSTGHPAVFSALAFEELLDLYVRLNIEKAQVIKATEEELLAGWQDLVKADNES